MSILSFLKGVLSLFIDNFPKFVEKLFSKIPGDLKKPLQVIIDLVNNLKYFIDSPLSDVITSIIPGTADDKLKKWLSDKLPEILEGLNLLKDGVITLSEDPGIKGDQLADIATGLARQLTDMPAGQARITVEVMYQNS